MTFRKPPLKLIGSESSRSISDAQIFLESGFVIFCSFDLFMFEMYLHIKLSLAHAVCLFLIYELRENLI